MHHSPKYIDPYVVHSLQLIQWQDLMSYIVVAIADNRFVAVP